MLNYKYTIKIPMNRVKKCNKCGKRLFLCALNFHKDKTKKTNYRGQCKSCVNQVYKTKKEQGVI